MAMVLMEKQRESGQANFDFYTDSKNDKYQGQREVPGSSSGPRRQVFACLTCGHTTHAEDISGLWICSTCWKMRPPDTSIDLRNMRPLQALGCTCHILLLIQELQIHLRGHLVLRPMKAVQDETQEKKETWWTTNR